MGKHYKWPFSIAMLNYQRLYQVDIPEIQQMFSPNMAFSEVEQDVANRVNYPSEAGKELIGGMWN